MPIVLPDRVRPAVSLSPSILLIYGVPKVGKTEILTRLNNCLIMDLEKGTRAHDAMAVEISNLAEFNETLNAIREKAKNSGGVMPYENIAIDTVDELEAMAELYHTILYNNDVKKNPIGSDGKKREVVSSVYDLPYGKGYYYVREEVKSRIKAVAKLCKHVILVSHVRDKEISQKTGMDIKDKDISLTGRLSSIVCSIADAIGFVYRDDMEVDENNVPKLKISFETMNDSATMGARAKHLRGNRMSFEWPSIFID